MKHIDFLEVHKLRLWESLRKSNKETLYLLSIMIRYITFDYIQYYATMRRMILFIKFLFFET